jgi:CBS domain-containing protein
VREIMSAPLVLVPGVASLSEALLLMREKGVRHLLVRDTSGRISGVVRGMDLLQMHRNSSTLVSREIRAARSAEDLADCRGMLLELVKGLAVSGARQRSTSRVFTEASDLIVSRLVELAVRDLGAPPAPFAFLALGSEGRGEQTPGSDQDNAILFQCPAGEDPSEARGYFLSLGEKVCGWLDGMGVPRCPGGVMAMNPSWCASREEWEGYFSRWILQPEPREILDFNIFFDLRCVSGEAALTEGLLESVRKLLSENPPFFFHHARDALARRIPTLRKGGELDAKEAMAPLVSFARIYALRRGIRVTNTLDRLEALRDAEPAGRQSFEDAAEAYGLLLRLRLSSQLAGRGNIIDSSSLSHSDETLLREAVSRLSLVQKRINWDFLGTL